MSRPAIVIVGAGFSGTLVSLWLRSCAPEGTRISLVDGHGQFATGLAYQTTNPNHLLNVPAGRMGAFPDRPHDFMQWLEQQPPSRLQGVAPAVGAFVPRSLYGAYLRQKLDDAVGAEGPTQVELVHDTVVAATDTPDGVSLQLASGTTLRADIVVLATGNAPPAAPHASVAALQQAGVWQADPWADTAFTQLDPAAPVLLVGTGLTMVDTVISLLDAGHAGPIHALSRRGQLPRRHAAHHPTPIQLPAQMPGGLAALTRWVRQEAARSVDAGHGWHPVFEALRPVTQSLWQALTPTERGRFRRHLCAWWDVHRHRIAPQIAERVDAARTSGQLQVHAGRLVGCEIDGAAASVTFRCRASGEHRRLPIARAFNCTGPYTDIARGGDELMLSLLRSGVARSDPLKLGLDVTAEGTLIGADGTPSSRLFAVGPLTKGSRWEITAVPDIRSQCHDLAHALSRQLSQSRDALAAR